MTGDKVTGDKVNRKVTLSPCHLAAPDKRSERGQGEKVKGRKGDRMTRSTEGEN